MNYTVQTSEGKLEVEWQEKGWVGAGWGEVCVEDWGVIEEEGDREFTFVVEGKSVLFGTVARATHTFNVSFPSSISSPRQISACPPLLWDFSPLSLYGIQTFPSGLSLLPPSLRSSPLSIITKALSPCSAIGMSKDILAPFIMDWTFMDPIPDGLAGLDANDWAEGALLVVPSVFLEDRRAFPMNEPVGIKVNIFFLLLINFLFSQ